MIRVGQGFDIHRLVEDPERPLVLGGVVFDSKWALVGHSDGDLVAHCAAEALLGASGLGDLGTHFPDTDDRFADADSIYLLSEVARSVRSAGWIPGNVDVSVVADEPKIGPVRKKMQEILSAAVQAPVTVKGRRPEQIGALGRGEGIAAFAVAIVTQP